MFCQNCGAPLRENARFCHVCGEEQLSKELDGTPTAGQAIQGADTSEIQPLLGAYTWENVKINGEFKNGVGTITITFS